MKYRLIGDRDFYKTILVIALPIMLQTAITNFVALLDNLMVGSLGTLQMSAVSISNQLINVFQLLTFATINASGIFLAQYCGKGDEKGMSDSFRLKIYTTLIMLTIALSIFFFKGNDLILLYLKNNDAAVINETLLYGHSYLNIMLLGLAPFAASCVLSFSLREVGDTLPPMIASTCAVAVNVFFNYCLIFGHFGFPAMGVNGAAIATVISRFAEFLIILSYLINKKPSFFVHTTDTFAVPETLVKNVLIKGFPLVINEFFYAFSMALIVQAYSMLGISAIAANNIVTTVSNLTFVANVACGNTIAIIVGQKLGAGKIEEARETDIQIIFFSFCLNILVGALLFLLCPYIPQLYNTTTEIRALATSMLKVYAVYTPISAIYLSCYFTVRAGGNTTLTFFFDGFYSALISLPIAYALVYLTDLGIVMVYLIVMMADIFKVIIGLVLIASGKWAKNIVSD